MEIIYNPRSYRAAFPSALTIGNFDGVHLGHQEILNTLVKSARASKTTSVVLSFEPHPLQFLIPKRAPILITPLVEKISIIKNKWNPDILAILEFNKAVSELSGEQFVKQIILRSFRAKHVFVGNNFMFGHRRSGNILLLQELSKKFNFVVHIVPEVVLRGSRVSSTRIRNLIQCGKISTANRLLGRYHTISGTIVPGRGLGKKLLLPTLNIIPTTELIPCPGVYVSESLIQSQHYPSVTNVGWAPTVSAKKLIIETHVLDFNLNKPPTKLSIAFLHRLRDEKTFRSIGDLKTQLLTDCRRARRFFSFFKKTFKH